MLILRSWTKDVGLQAQLRETIKRFCLLVWGDQISTLHLSKKKISILLHNHGTNATVHNVKLTKY